MEDLSYERKTQDIVHTNSNLQAGVSLWEIFCWSQKHSGLEHDAGTGICSGICSCPPEFLNAGLIIYWVTSKKSNNLFSVIFCDDQHIQWILHLFDNSSVEWKCSKWTALITCFKQIFFSHNNQEFVELPEFN